MGFETIAVQKKRKQQYVAMMPSHTYTADNQNLLTPDTPSTLTLKEDTTENLFNNRLDINKLTTLDLCGCSLIDLPPSLFLPNLRRLSLAHNRLTRVPVCLFTSLDDLEYLDLSHNRLSNFDMEPQCTTKLTYLNLSFNKFRNIPKWILMFKAVNVEELNFSCNKSTHYNHINSCNILKCKMLKLNLVNSCLIDKDYTFLRCFKDLEYLDISNICNEHINVFYDIDNLFTNLVWRQLHVLKMNKLSLTIFPEGIAWVESLVELYINYNHISWLPNGIEYMVNLKILDVSHNHLIVLPEQILKLKLLNTIKAQGNCIEVIPNLTSLNKLTYLDLYNNLLKDIPVQLNSLKFLDLEMNYLNTNALRQLEGYLLLKGNLREVVNDVRSDGFLDDIQKFKTLSSSSESSHPDNECIAASPVIIEENWDIPERDLPEILCKNPEVDSADDEYDQDVSWYNHCKRSNTKKVYVADEDWMFEDVD